ncbi:lysozyme [uncultured Pseudacidovorax sp.]|uniref:lysozyme n=1 Tax=uncultured Pseudacidovorax sp. TaxID=679313 RepID=UPI0025D8711A|nr:lysozyme [uncultured Pseudacidovorax sp.]
MAMTRSQRIGAATLAAAALAAPFEGLRQWAYRDPVGIPTICFGSTRGVQMGDFKTKAECEALLTAEMDAAISAVERCVPGLPTQMLAAWGSAVYNLGPVLVCDPFRSTAARLLAEGRLLEACDQLPRWNRAKGLVLPGLTKRRAAEQELCRA